MPVFNPGLTTNDGTFAKETGGNLDTIVAKLVALLIAQGASSTGVLGPLVQGLSNYTAPAANDETVVPFSLDQSTRLRVLTSTEESETAWDQPLPDSWNTHVADSGFDLDNNRLIDTAWES